MDLDNNFKIAGNFRVNDWKNLKDAGLSTEDVSDTKNWDKAFKYLRSKDQNKIS